MRSESRFAGGRSSVGGRATLPRREVLRIARGLPCASGTGPPASRGTIARPIREKPWASWAASQRVQHISGRRRLRVGGECELVRASADDARTRTSTPTGLKETPLGVERDAMGSVLSVLVGAAIAAGVVLGFWLLLDLADGTRRRTGRPF